MVEAILALAGFLLAFAAAADIVIRSAGRLAGRLGARGFAVGALLLAVATSLPELGVGLAGVAEGDFSISLGNAMGATMGLLLLVFPVMVFAGAKVGRLRKDVVRSAGIVAIASAAYALLHARPEILGASLILCFLAGARTVAEEGGLLAGRLGKGARRDVIMLLLALALLAVVSRALVHAVEELSAEIGESTFFLSVLLLSLGTSLPEMIVEMTSVRRGRTEIGLGDLFGSAVTNLTLVLGTSTLAAWAFGVPTAPPKNVHVVLAGILAGAAGSAYMAERGENKALAALMIVLWLSIVAYIG